MSNATQAFILVVILVLLATTGRYFSTLTPSYSLDAKTLLTLTDTAIFNLKVQQYSATGSLANSLQTPVIRHIPKNNLHWMKTPHIIIGQPDQPAWEIDAKQATALYGGKQITFNNNVRIHQNKGEHNEESTLTTESITYFPQTKIALTSKDVLFTQPGNQVQSKGLRANLEKKHIQLLGRARGVYDPNHG